MNQFGIFTDRRGRRWICGHALKILFGIVETGNRHFWNYDKLCLQYDQRSNANASNQAQRRKS
ncbi:MAG: hypothetical protein IKO74_02670 [Selenomonadaceae bacterium]|nr:hypothetical protein [Selenomonadaceae bacterium]MBR4641610.1 hypothetical protein [Selenomonadaceae bacterium]